MIVIWSLKVSSVSHQTPLPKEHELKTSSCCETCHVIFSRCPTEAANYIRKLRDVRAIVAFAAQAAKQER